MLNFSKYLSYLFLLLAIISCKSSEDTENSYCKFQFGSESCIANFHISINGEPFDLYREIKWSSGTLLSAGDCSAGRNGAELFLYSFLVTSFENRIFFLITSEPCDLPFFGGSAQISPARLRSLTRESENPHFFFIEKEADENWRSLFSRDHEFIQLPSNSIGDIRDENAVLETSGEK